MVLKVFRVHFLGDCTIGRIYFDGVPQEMFTLEDVVRAGPKVPGETAIPPGRYTVVIDYSNRFHRELPLILDVPGFTGVRIHPGNTDADTEGCILVGMGIGPGGNSLIRSREAFEKLFSTLKTASSIELEIG